VNEALGLVDLQVNGYAGIDFASPTLNIGLVIQAAQILREQGTVLFCPAVVTSPWETYRHVLPVLARAKQELAGMDPDVYAQIAGIHLEGPFVSSVDGARGVHDLSFIRPASSSDLDALIELSRGSLRLLTLAPEIQGGLDLVRFAVTRGILIGIGHTLASPAIIHAAVDAGARYSTHLGNGLPSTIHRHQNPLWVQLAEPRLVAMLIADGHHLPADFVKVVISAKSTGGVIVTSDAASPAGLPAGDYSFCGKTVRLDPGGKLFDPQSGYLAGSSANLRQCRDWLSSLGIPPVNLDLLCRENALALLAS
jgi:N-acetylglucosamine-6-phosphate deacetylase